MHHFEIWRFGIYNLFIKNSEEWVPHFSINIVPDVQTSREQIQQPNCWCKTNQSPLCAFHAPLGSTIYCSKYLPPHPPQNEIQGPMMQWYQWNVVSSVRPGHCPPSCGLLHCCLDNTWFLESIQEISSLWSHIWYFSKC